MRYHPQKSIKAVYIICFLDLIDKIKEVRPRETKFTDYSLRSSSFRRRGGAGFDHFSRSARLHVRRETPEEAIEKRQGTPLTAGWERRLNGGDQSRRLSLPECPASLFSVPKKPLCKARSAKQAGVSINTHGPVLHRRRRWDGKAHAGESRG